MRTIFAKNKFFEYLVIFVASFLIGLLAGKLAVPVSPTYAATDIIVNSATTSSTLKETATIEEYAFEDIAYPASYRSGLYMPTIGFSSSVSTASISGNTVAVPAYGVARIGNLLIGHNPGTFSAILGLNIGDIFYLDGQKYQIYDREILDVSDNMRFVGQETTSSLSNGSKGLVLMTCYGNMKTFKNGTTSAAQRFLVYAKAV